MCLDELRPDAAKRHPGRQVIRADSPGRRRATQAIDDGRRGKGSIFGAFIPATGVAVTAPYGGRTTAAWVAFLAAVDAWGDPTTHTLYAILDNLSTHRAPDVLLWALNHPRWEVVFQPTSAASLNLIEPWWKILRTLALKGRRFETWAAICDAVAAATD